jgi:hypothetical protein
MGDEPQATVSVPDETGLREHDEEVDPLSDDEIARRIGELRALSNRLAALRATLSISLPALLVASCLIVLAPLLLQGEPLQFAFERKSGTLTVFAVLCFAVWQTAFFVVAKERDHAKDLAKRGEDLVDLDDAPHSQAASGRDEPASPVAMR